MKIFFHGIECHAVPTRRAVDHGFFYINVKLAVIFFKKTRVLCEAVRFFAHLRVICYFASIGRNPLRACYFACHGFAQTWLAKSVLSH